MITIFAINAVLFLILAVILRNSNIADGLVKVLFFIMAAMNGYYFFTLFS